jgi:hypothetical protein
MRSNPEVPSAELVLAAIDRAVRQSARPVTDVPAAFIADHLALNRRSGAWRQALRLLRELEAVGEVMQGRRLSVTVWALTDAGRERLARVVRDGQGLSLPESPQLRRWRDSRLLAAQDADRSRAELLAALKDGLQLLNEAATPSDAWLALSSRVARAADRVGGGRVLLGRVARAGGGRPRLERGAEDAKPRTLRRIALRTLPATQRTNSPWQMAQLRPTSTAVSESLRVNPRRRPQSISACSDSPAAGDPVVPSCGAERAHRLDARHSNHTAIAVSRACRSASQRRRVEATGPALRDLRTRWRLCGRRVASGAI